MKKLTALLIAALFGVITAGIVFAGEGPETIELKTAKKGTITFAHHKHQSKMECGECHHGEGHSAFKKGMEIKKCDTCHKAGFKNARLNSMKKVMHKRCKTCHKKHKAEGAPTKCKGCHKK